MTSRISFYTADVFTGEMFGGNQLAVFPAARGLDARLMQAIAWEFNLSETVFVFPPDDPTHTRKLRIFTPGTKLPFAGHPTAILPGGGLGV
jgi:trans-2,3-dihydro-3-hydroxyanthranilate isomerase